MTNGRRMLVEWTDPNSGESDMAESWLNFLEHWRLTEGLRLITMLEEHGIRIVSENNDLYVEFENAEDATAFVLRWS